MRPPPRRTSWGAYAAMVLIPLVLAVVVTRVARSKPQQPVSNPFTRCEAGVALLNDPSLVAFLPDPLPVVVEPDGRRWWFSRELLAELRAACAEAASLAAFTTDPDAPRLIEHVSDLDMKAAKLTRAALEHALREALVRPPRRAEDETQAAREEEHPWWQFWRGARP